MKVDLYNCAERYKRWKEQAIKNDYVEYGLTKKNSDILKQFIFDMEIGRNVSVCNKRGGRSFSRLNALRTRLSQIFVMLQKRKIVDISRVKDEDVIKLFSDMRNGVIKTKSGGKYKSTADYVKVFRSFWNYLMKVYRKDGKELSNVAIDLDARYDDKPRWVYLDEKQVETLLKKAGDYYKPLLSFLFDAGCRVTETFSLKAEDITEEKGIVYVNISNEISKGGNSGRKIRLMLCGKNLLEYIRERQMKPQDSLFSNNPVVVNRYLGILAKETFGDANSKAGDLYANLTMYDFRHNSCCFWIQRYKRSADLMYRFGWKSERFIHYYSEFLGLRDTISKEDMYVDITKTELEKEIMEIKRNFETEKEKIQEQLESMKTQMRVNASLVLKLKQKR